MEPWQECVISEKAELDQKIEALIEFGRTEAWSKLSEWQRNDLMAQNYWMLGYSRALTTRIEKF
jgi:hypothetical protein